MFFLTGDRRGGETDWSFVSLLSLPALSVLPPSRLPSFRLSLSLSFAAVDLLASLAPGSSRTSKSDSLSDGIHWMRVRTKLWALPSDSESLEVLDISTSSRGFGSILRH